MCKSLINCILFNVYSYILYINQDIPLGAWDMAQYIKDLLYKHEEIISDAQYPHKC